MSRWEFLLGMDGPFCADCKAPAQHHDGRRKTTPLSLYCGQWRCAECISEIERAEKYGEDTREEFKRRIGR